MKTGRLLLLLTFIIFSQQAFAQIFNPVKWSYEVTSVQGEEATITFKATLEDKWAIYSQFLDEGGPVPTSFNFNQGDHFNVIGKAQESEKNKVEGFDEMFEMQVIKFKKEAVFQQKVKIISGGKPISGYIEYMVCDDARCLPPTEFEFSIEVNKKKNNPVTEAPKAVDVPPSTTTVEKKVPATKPNTTVVEKPVVQNTPTKTPAAPTSKINKPAAKKEDTKPKAEQQVAAQNTTEQPAANTSDKLTDLKSILAPLTIKPAEGNLLEPYAWTARMEPTKDNAFWLHFYVKMEKGWNIYSQNIGEEGPVPTSILFQDENQVEKLGSPTEDGIKKKEGFDEFFQVEVTKFFEGAVFSQKIRPKQANQPLSGEVEFMVCDAERCLPPSGIPFTADFEHGTVSMGLLPDEAANVAIKDSESLFDGLYPAEFNNILKGAPDGSCNEKILGTTNYFKLFLLGFLGGLVALLTPCVFPMIPLTVSFFTKSADSKSKGLRDAFLYGGFIALIYLLFSLPFHLIGSIDPNIFNDISTNVPLNIFFFVIFIVFAFSFFGFYEITLPSSWQNKSASAENAGGLIGIFFMALTLALVSFSCTGPILGSLLAGALTSEGGAWQLTAGMGGFGVALALPFALFAAFPGMMKALPKSGGWMTTLKVVLGFIELALALKFLSNADLVLHQGWLKVEVFLGLWILITIGMGLYLLGFIKFPHDDPGKKVSPVRMVLGILSFVFAGYMATGFTFDEKANSLHSLTLLSGIAPPACYSIFYPCDCPQNLNCFKDLESGLAEAKEKNKPILLDFTGHACVNCRKMEENVWPKKEVYSKLKDGYVLISLYVDEKITIPEEEQVKVVSKLDGREVTFRTTGKKWSFFQAEYFKNNSQPFYVLVSPDGELLNEPVGYMPDSKEYAEFLQCGINNFNTMQQQSRIPKDF